MISTDLFKRTMQEILGKLNEEKTLFKKENIQLEGVSKDEHIDNLILKASDSLFRLLLMGRFSAGKSALINALLGERLLPEKALPTTALITEIYYSTEKKVIMFPKPGKWKGGDSPFEIEPTLAEIKKYATLDNKSGINQKEANRIDSCFEKMVVYWPLELLKDGVCIIDSPGIDDPYSNDHIVESYVPKADAILFCINGTNAYSDKDKNTLERIVSQGYKPLIVTTYFDVMTAGMEETEIQEEIIDPTFKNFYSRHTTRDFCHYVNSRQALEAKKAGNQEELVKSGFYEMEQFLGTYLTQYKGREKIANITEAARQYNQNQKKRLEGILVNLDTPMSEFDERIAEAEKKLNQAKQQGDLLIRDFRLQIKEEKEKVDELIPVLYEKLYMGVSLDGFEPATNFSMWHPKKSSTQIADECANEIKRRNEALIAEWNNNILNPQITSIFRHISSTMEKQFQQFSEDISGANVSLGINVGKADTETKGATKVALFAYALFTGDWITALLGNVFGGAAFGRTLACEFAAGLVLGIVALFTPVGLPALVIAALAGLIGGVAWTAAKAAKSIKKKTIEKTRENLVADKDKIIESVQEQCGKIFAKAEASLQIAIDDDINGVKKTIAIIRQEKIENAAKIEKRKRILNDVLSFIENVDMYMTDIRKKFNL